MARYLKLGNADDRFVWDRTAEVMYQIDPETGHRQRKGMSLQMLDKHSHGYMDDLGEAEQFPTGLPSRWSG